MDSSSKSAEEIRELFAPYFVEMNFQKNVTLFHEGDVDGMMIFILEGSVKIFRVLPDGNSITFFILDQGNFLGFLPMIDGGPYPVSAETLDEVKALVITHKDFTKILKSDPELALPVLQYLAKRFRNAFDIIVKRSNRDALPVVASAFLELYKRESRNDITLPVSSKEYALSIGLTPESFSRKVSELVKENIIQRIDINKFKILDVDKLRAFSSPINFF